MLELENITVRYGQHRALEEASVTVKEGEIVVILGANGAGKSTLLKAASGICEGSVQGSARLNGTELIGLGANKIVDEGLALVPEGRGVFPELTVKENLTLGAYSQRARDEEQQNLVRVLDLFPKLGDRASQIVGTMSGGEQQMVAIGRAMMSNPRILTLDEPSLGLSPLLSKELFANLAKVRDLGLGILLVEQNAKQSLAIADRGYLLENAHVTHEDTAMALMNDPAVQAAYLGAVASGDQTPASPPPQADETPDMPAAFQVKPASRLTTSADVLLGRSINDLVGAADAASRKSVAPAKTAHKLAVAVPSDRLSAALSEIEMSAKRALHRTPTARPLRTSRGRAVHHDQAPAAPPEPKDEKPVVIEVYRAPRVEVYRRQPGGNEFERD